MPPAVRTAPDWTPVVLLVCSLSLFLSALSWALPRWLDLRVPAPGVQPPPTVPPGEVVVWVQAAAPDGLKLALAPVWGDAEPDREHDRALAARLGLEPAQAPAWLRLLVFNASPRAQRITPAQLALRVEGPQGTARLRSLPALLAAAGRTPAVAQQRLLSSLGAWQEQVHVPAGQSAALLLCFEGPLDLAQAVRVVGGGEADGAAFSRRPMGRHDFQRLLAEPDTDLVRDL